jgi:amidase
MNELCGKGAGDLARMIATGEVTSTEVIEAHLARIADVNPDLNAVTVTLADEARAAAADVDRSVAAGEPLGPLAGVPFTVKENIDVEAQPTRSHASSATDSRVSERLPGDGEAWPRDARRGADGSGLTTPQDVSRRS